MAHRFRRSRLGLGRSDLSDGQKQQLAVPDGAVVAGRWLIEDGHSREDVEAFLSESFRRVDVQATLERLYVDAAHTG